MMKEQTISDPTEVTEIIANLLGPVLAKVVTAVSECYSEKVTISSKVDVKLQKHQKSEI